jgi:hypothetical protein
VVGDWGVSTASYPTYNFREMRPAAFVVTQAGAAPEAYTMHRTLVAVALAASFAAAAPASLFGPLWSLLTSAWNETGCHIDPSGRCATGTAGALPTTAQGDEGCHIDPDGRCAS